jgi:hypothetical protein
LIFRRLQRFSLRCSNAEDGKIVYGAIETMRDVADELTLGQAGAPVTSMPGEGRGRITLAVTDS